MAFLSTSFLFFLSSLSLLFMVQAHESRSHGLAQENPVALSPAAFDFFHPDAPSPSSHFPCAAPKCAPSTLYTGSGALAKPWAAQVRQNMRPAQPAIGSRLGAGGIVGIVFGSMLVVVLAMGLYYVAVTRRANMVRADSTVRANA